MENKIATDLEQSVKLVELGIDPSTADMHWESISDDDHRLGLFTAKETKESLERMQYTLKTTFNVKLSPAWSLSALLEMLPLKINVGNDLCPLKIDKEYNNKNLKVGYGVCYLDKNSNGVGYFKENPLDAVFEMIVYLKENKWI